jgi:hypothetical protein
MNPAVLGIIACIVCILMCGLVTVAYQVLNKPVTPQAPIVSDDIVQQFKDAQGILDNGLTYTVVSGSYMGSSSFLIKQTVTVDAKNCKSICSDDKQCGGFQIHPDGITCDILQKSNIGGYPFPNSGWQYYQISPQYTPLKITSMLQDQSPSGAQVGTPQNVGLEKCSNFCSSNTTCTGFTVGPGNTCTMWNANGTGYIGPLPAPGINYYTLTPVQSKVASF